VLAALREALPSYTEVTPQGAFLPPAQVGLTFVFMGLMSILAGTRGRGTRSAAATAVLSDQISCPGACRAPLAAEDDGLEHLRRRSDTRQFRDQKRERGC